MVVSLASEAAIRDIQARQDDAWNRHDIQAERPSRRRCALRKCGRAGQARVLPRRKMSIPRRPGNKHSPGLATTHVKIFVQSLARHRHQLEPDGPPVFSLMPSRPVDRVPVGCDVVSLEGNGVAAAQLAVSSRACAAPTAAWSGWPDMPRSQRRLQTGEFGAATRCLGRQRIAFVLGQISWVTALLTRECMERRRLARTICRKMVRDPLL